MATKVIGYLVVACTYQAGKYKGDKFVQVFDILDTPDGMQAIELTDGREVIGVLPATPKQ